MKNILYLYRRHPAELVYSLETLQAAVISSIFEQKVSLLFRDEGVRQLTSDASQGRLADQFELWRTTLAEVDAYGIKEVYACQRSMEVRHLLVGQLIVPVAAISEPEQTKLIARHDVVVSD